MPGDVLSMEGLGGAWHMSFSGQLHRGGVVHKAHRQAEMKDRVWGNTRELCDRSLKVGENLDWEQADLNDGIANENGFKRWRVFVTPNQEGDDTNSDEKNSDFSGPYARRGTGDAF